MRKISTSSMVRAKRMRALEEEQITDAFCLIRGGQCWLHGVHLHPYSHGNIWNVDPDRKRRLLLHRRQIDYLDGMQWSEAKWNLFEMPAIDISGCCIPAECDNIKLPIECEIASRWDAYLLCDICRHFASVMLHFASLISHNLRCIPAYTHQIPNGISSHLLRDNL